MVDDDQVQKRRAEAKRVMDELVQHAKQHKSLSLATIKSLLTIQLMDRATLEKGKVYFFFDPIAGADAQQELAAVGSQIVEYHGFKNAPSDQPGTPAAHLFTSRLWKQESFTRLTTVQFRQLYDERKVFLITGIARPPASAAGSPISSSTTTDSPQVKSALDDPGFSAVIQALAATTLRFQTEDRVSFQNIVTDILQGQRVFNTLHDVNQALGIIQVAMVAFESKVSAWENRFAAFFQQNRPETVGMTTINNLKAQLNKGRSQLGPTKYQFGRLVANLEQAKIALDQLPKEKDIPRT